MPKTRKSPKTAAAKRPPTKKKSRISKLAQCIRRTAATAPVSRKYLPDSSKYDKDVFTPESSGKFTALLEKIRNLDAVDMRDHGTKFKHFIFTDVREAAAGAKALAAFMIAAGYELRMGQEKKLVKRKGKVFEKKTGATVYRPKDPVKGGCDGFAILQSVPMWKNPVSVNTKKDILKAYNSRPDNVNGELLRIIILDSKYKEGIDLFDVKYVHLLEPAIASSDLKQAVGRATRYCGQRGLHFVPRRGWPLQVYIYNTDLPNRTPFTLGDGQKVDAHTLMLHKSGLDLALLNLTKELTVLAIASAVDYDLNYKINNFDIESALLENPVIAEVEMSGGGRKKLLALRNAGEITPQLLGKCAKRKSKLFPFTVAKMRRVADEFGMPIPHGARREWFCTAIAMVPGYLDALLVADSPRTSTVSTAVESEVDVESVFPTPRESPRRGSIAPSIQELFEDAEKRAEAYAVLQRLKKLPFEEFQTTINDMYAKYKWASPVVKNGCDVVAAGAPGRPVRFTQTQDFIRHYLTPDLPFKGLLAWHSVGTGKTCMAVAAATTEFEKAGYTILWVTRNALMADVYKNIFGSVCSIPMIERIEDGNPLPEGLAKQKRLLSRAWLPPISYKMLQNALEKKNALGRMLHEKSPQDPLAKTFLIIDEVHKLQDGDLSASEAADFSKIRNYIWESYAKSGNMSVRPLLMTATPITDSPKDLFEILNILIPDESRRLMPFESYRAEYSTEDGSIKESGKKYFQDRAKGLISYLNREYDPTTFAQPVFHTVAVPVGEALVPSVEALVDKCIAGVDVEVVEEEEDCSALEKDLEKELAALEASNNNKKTKAAAARTLKAKYKQLMKDCKARGKATRKAQKDAAKLVVSATKKCYRESKKQFTLKNRGSQLTAMEKCFGKPVKREFIKSAEFNKAIQDHVSGKSKRDSRSSVGAVRLTE